MKINQYQYLNVQKMIRNTLTEISRQAIVIPKIEDVSISWHNSAFIVQTPKAVYVYEFSYNLKCMDKRLDFIEFILQTPKLTPATKLVSNNFISFGVSNFELSQLIADPSLWAHSPLIVQEMACIIDSKWSPNEFYFRGEPLIAILNNIGNVNIFGKKNGTWVNLLDLSACVIKELKLVQPTNVHDLKTKANIVETSAVCWAPTPNKDESCFIMMGQKNGNILMWSLEVEKSEVKLKAYYQGCIKSDSNEVKSILWIDKGEGKVLLAVSNVLGQILLYDFTMCKTLDVLKMHIIWPHKDKMISQYINHTQVNNKTIIIFDKYRHFVAQMLDEDYNVISQYTQNVNDYRITTIVGNSSEFFLGTINFQMYKINIEISNDNLDVKLDLIEIKESFKNFEFFGMTFSKNDHIMAVVCLDRSVGIRKKPPQIDIIFYSTKLSHDPDLSILLNSEIKIITNLWDAIELLRYKIMKSKILPSDLNKLLTDGDIDIFNLKLYLVIAKMWHTLENNLKVPRGLLPEQVEAVKEKIMLKHAQFQLNELHKLILQNNIHGFEMETFIATKKYLKYYCQKYELKMENVISSVVYKSVKCEVKYVCQCCENDIELFSCISSHINMFCPISFTPIETNEYLLCTVCGITARIELYEKKTRCIFCDRVLQKYL